MRELTYPFPFGKTTTTQEIELPLVLEVRQAGVHINSISDLTTTRDSYPEAIPVLIKYLDAPLPTNLREAIVRALTVKEAKNLAFEPLYRRYLAEADDLTDNGVRYDIANALQYLAEKQDVPRLIELALNQSYGASRIAFIKRISASAGKKNITEIKQVLEELSNDPYKWISERAKRALKEKKYNK